MPTIAAMPDRERPHWVRSTGATKAKEYVSTHSKRIIPARAMTSLRWKGPSGSRSRRAPSAETPVVVMVRDLPGGQEHGQGAVWSAGFPGAPGEPGPDAGAAVRGRRGVR